MMPREIELAGQTFVVLPKAEYLRLREVRAPQPRTDAIAFGRQTVARSLKAARTHAGLTQEALAKKLRRSQVLVSRAETGAVSVGAKYVESVLRACRLPANWRPGTRRSAKSGL